MQSIGSLLAAHPDAAVGTLTGGTVGVAAAVGAMPLPGGSPWWLSWVLAVVVSSGPVLVVRVMMAWSAGRAKLAEARRKRALALRSDNDKANDAEAARLDEEADELEAQAAAARAFSGKVPTKTEPE